MVKGSKQKISVKKEYPTKRKINRTKVKQLVALGVSESDIARNQGVYQSSVAKYIHTLSPSEIEDYKARRADILAMSQVKALAVKNRVLNHVIDMPEDTFKALSESAKIGFGNLANVSGGTDYDKERTERGLDVTKVAIISTTLNDLRKMMDSNDSN
jgi:predicted transcriptional regulator